MGTDFQEYGVLNEPERIAQAKKCIKNLIPHIDEMTDWESEFVFWHEVNLQGDKPFGLTQHQLNLLKDLNERY